MMRGWVRGMLGAGGLAVLLGAGVLWRQQASDGPEKRYRLQTVQQGPVSQTVAANGTLNPTTVVQVGTQVSGTVRRLFVDFNSRVEAGQKLLELDDSLMSALARQSAASVANAEASLELTTANEARLKTLLADEYVSRQEVEQAVQARKSAAAQLKLARAQHEKDQVSLGYTVIRSPVDGIVIDRVVDVGQTVAASFQTPTLIKIAQDLSRMQIDSAFAEADVGNIRVGQKARFTVDAFPERSFQGEVRQIRLNASNQQNVVTYNVVVAVDNPDHLLLPGMTAYVSIAVATRENVLLVPNAALRFRPAQAPGGEAGGKRAEGSEGKKTGGGKGNRATVHVLADGQLKAVSVELGITDNRVSELLAGDLKAGDRVAIGDQAASDKPQGPVGMRLF